MLKSFLKKVGLALIVLFMAQAIALAQSGGSPGNKEPKTPDQATMKSRCANAVALKFPPCATSPTQCISSPFNLSTSTTYRTPFNCIFLQEPIGGKPGYDLFKATPSADYGTEYTLWNGEAIVGNESGPFQAILAYEEGKESQGSLGLLYNYLALIYNFMSGLIIAFVVLISIVGGIRMTTSAGSEEGFTSGRKMIIKALIGMAIWFTASVILYTINPTFFAF